MRWFLIACGLTIVGSCGGDADGDGADARVSIDAAPGQGYALRFFGNGGIDDDRVKILLDDVSNSEPGPPVDVGATDFTIELWMKAQQGDNPNGAVSCGPGISWVNSNIFVDRDRHSQSPSFGAGIAARSLVFAVLGPGDDSLTICGQATIDDGEWHHVALQRRRSDGQMWIWVDGVMDATGDGPDGDVSYPDDGQPMSVCPDGLCDYSDPYLVLGAEKHGYAGISYNGLVDELRISSVLRYEAVFTRPNAPFTADGNTVGLYHFDAGDGATAIDSSGVTGSVDGVINRGGTPPGPDWSIDMPF